MLLLGNLRYPCSAKNCQSAFLVRFPQDNLERRTKWCPIMDINDLIKRMDLCESHFNMRTFTDSLK